MNTYMEFINEEFFKKILNKDKSKDKSLKTRVDSCVDNILSFLKENDIVDWDGFMKMSTFNRDVINKIIDHEIKDFKELKEVNFLIRLELSDNQQLREYLKELEDLEDYEKCAKIIKKINKL
jgi:hypothetical protein